MIDHTETLKLIMRTLQIPAAEYVPAIGDVFTIIDRALAAALPNDGAQGDVPDSVIAILGNFVVDDPQHGMNPEVREWLISVAPGIVESGVLDREAFPDDNDAMDATRWRDLMKRLGECKGCVILDEFRPEGEVERKFYGPEKLQDYIDKQAQVAEGVATQDAVRDAT